ncbi:MAG: hypothetical protein V1738_05850 [Patescibacteria group bacterium]
MNLASGDEKTMFSMADGIQKDLLAVAKAMIAAGESTRPVLSPDGTVLMHLVLAEDQLRLTIASVDVDGTTVFGGLRK